jgi:hypothetical protein
MLDYTLGGMLVWLVGLNLAYAAFGTIYLVILVLLFEMLLLNDG